MEGDLEQVGEADKVVVSGEMAGRMRCAPVLAQVVNAYALPAAPWYPIKGETPASNRNAPGARARWCGDRPIRGRPIQ